MKQNLVINAINSTNDMGIRNSCRHRIEVPVDELEVGKTIRLSEYRNLKVISLTDEELIFVINNSKPYILNRYWQVLGTVSMGIPNEYVSESERFVFLFETPMTEDEEEEGMGDRIDELLDQLTESADYWKNIPIVRELLHLFKDCIALRSIECDLISRVDYCSVIADSEVLSQQETPRLCQSLFEYAKICYEQITPDDGEIELEQHFLNIWDDSIYNLAWTVNPDLTDEQWESVVGYKGKLRYDLVQRTPEWEKCIYEVEKECDERLKHQPRAMGFCHAYWPVKRELLAKRGITWRTPAQMNPKVRFD